MTLAIEKIIEFMTDWLSVINSSTFNFYGFDIGIIDVIIGFLFIGSVVTIFWKGAKG